MNEVNIEQERRDFEAHIHRIHQEAKVQLDDETGAWPGQYTSYLVQTLWEGWLARARKAATPATPADGELLPCPFCNTQATLKGGLEAQENYSIWCENLHHMDGGYDRDALIRRWNTRAS